MSQRVKKVIATFKNNKIDAYLVLNNINVRYLTNFPAESSCLLICRKKAFYITDSRYYLEAKNVLKDFEIRCIKTTLKEEIADIIIAEKLKVLGLNESAINVAEYKSLKSKLRGKASLIGLAPVIESFRAIKDFTERGLIREALSAHQEVFRFLQKIIIPGLTEQDILVKLKVFMLSKGLSFSFDPIIASGVNSCFPHAKVTKRKVRKNDIILVDMGIDWKGYKSDLTRMFFLGRISKSIREIYEIVHQAQQIGIQKIKAGVNANYLDKIVRDFFSSKGLEKYFTHALGHGVGLEVHESPRLSVHNPCKLKEGMVITIEPALYFPNKFGIRLEEMVLVTKEGCERLSDHIN